MHNQRQNSVARVVVSCVVSRMGVRVVVSRVCSSSMRAVVQRSRQLAANELLRIPYVDRVAPLTTRCEPTIVSAFKRHEAPTAHVHQLAALEHNTAEFGFGLIVLQFEEVHSAQAANENVGEKTAGASY